MKCFIGNLEFKTKKECLNYTRNFIRNLGVCKIDKENANYSFFKYLLKNHPEYDDKKGVGIDYFYIELNKLNRNAYQTMIRRLDGTEIDFSWVYCCEFKRRKITQDLTNAMRQAISQGTIKYKISNNLICNFCKKENEDDEDYSDFHVDHIHPFSLIKDSFIKSTKLNIPDKFEDCVYSKMAIFRTEDIDFRNEWVKYHNNIAKYQILCRNCNIIKSNKI